MQTRTAFAHIQSWVCLGKIGRKWVQIAFFFPLSTKIPSTTYYQIESLPFCTYFSLSTCCFVFKKIKSQITTPIDVIATFFWPTCFHNESNLGTRSLSCPLMIVHTLHLTYVTFPLIPTTNFAQGNFATHEFWKWQFISFLFFSSYCSPNLPLLGLDQQLKQ